MGKKTCATGLKWNSVINGCIPNTTDTGAKTEPLTNLPLQVVVDQESNRAAVPRADSVTLLSPAIWIFMMLATVGSILVLALWFIIYRRQTRPSRVPDAEPGQEPPQKTQPPASGQLLPRETPVETEAPPPCARLHPGAHTESQWEEEGFVTCGSPAKHAGKEEDRGLMTRGHRIPLPATELGGTALVTTKTV